MPKFNGTLEYALQAILLQVAPHRMGLLARGGFISVEVAAQLHTEIKAELQTVLAQLVRIRTAAEAGSIRDVQDELDRKFDFGLE